MVCLSAWNAPVYLVSGREVALLSVHIAISVKDGVEVFVSNAGVLHLDSVV